MVQDAVAALWDGTQAEKQKGRHEEMETAPNSPKHGVRFREPDWGAYCAPL